MAARTSGPSRPPRPPTPDAGLLGYVEAVPLPAALLDAQGRIRVLNHLWQEQARRGALVDTTDAVGHDYLHDLRDAKGFNSAAGKALADAVEGVLTGRVKHASQAYELRGDGGHWEATATRLELEGEPHVLLVHRNRSLGWRTTQIATRLGDVVMEREQQTAVARDRQRLLAASEQAFHAPLTPVRLQLHLLKNGALGKLDARQLKALERIERNVHRWWHLQQRLLEELQALEVPQHEPEGIDLSELVDEALQPFGERALKAGIRLRVDRSDAPMPVHVDRRATVQAMMLLLDHAIRQTPAGGMVWARLRPVGHDHEWVLQDQDPSMEPAQAETLLADQAPETSLRNGLLHVQAVLARHGGTLSTRCPGPGRGLEVCMSLPGT